MANNLNHSHIAAGRTDLSETLVSMVVVSTAALKQAGAVGGTEGVLWAVNSCGLTVIMRWTDVVYYQNTATVLDVMCHTRRLSDGNIHSCPVWLHIFFWPSQKRVPSLTSTLSHDVLPPGQTMSSGKILTELQRNGANLIFIRSGHSFVSVFVTGYLHVIHFNKSLKCCVTDVDNGIVWEVSEKNKRFTD